MGWGGAHLAMSGGLFGRQDWEKLPVFSGQKSGILQGPGQPTAEYEAYMLVGSGDPTSKSKSDSSRKRGYGIERWCWGKEQTGEPLGSLWNNRPYMLNTCLSSTMINGKLFPYFSLPHVRATYNSNRRSLGFITLPQPTGCTLQGQKLFQLSLCKSFKGWFCGSSLICWLKLFFYASERGK